MSYKKQIIYSSLTEFEMYQMFVGFSDSHTFTLTEGLQTFSEKSDREG